MSLSLISLSSSFKCPRPVFAFLLSLEGDECTIYFPQNVGAGNLQVLIIEWAEAGRGDEKLAQFVLRDCNNKLITILSTRSHF